MSQGGSQLLTWQLITLKWTQLELFTSSQVFTATFPYPAWLMQVCEELIRTNTRSVTSNFTNWVKYKPSRTSTVKVSSTEWSIYYSRQGDIAIHLIAGLINLIRWRRLNLWMIVGINILLHHLMLFDVHVYKIFTTLNRRRGHLIVNTPPEKSPLTTITKSVNCLHN